MLSDRPAGYGEVARKVYETNYASSEEISDILKLLRENHIPHYETPKGILGFSVGAIWVSRDEDYRKARRLIEEYDSARAQRVREEYARRAAASQYGSFVTTLSNIWRLIIERPYETLFYASIVVLLIAIHLLFYKAISNP